ncbi:glycine cleavage system aminomethyltransferase GcvT [Salegentibacter salegens]|uniref:Aminomethyltransferase n=1 Tax=Salegentibacter salegens TaxID=143223 RepID=A0A1M7LNY7_9FLAO|nr:glycine cleavage system aminomethyltransferase GcvT [Salegentibacter salegens]PRX39541.1 aminomethyltransferase [Salegentibacter salegens]SHM79800.1 aminomethyltransferase [Salegentibacter salegens]
MKEVALAARHKELNAKMVPFAGYNMPVSYEGVNIEHQNVREKLGVFDVSHMGEFLITGDKALELIQKITTNDASKLVDGKAQYTVMPNETGGIVDDLIIYRINSEKYLLVVNASNIDKDWNWIAQHNSMDATMRDMSDEFSLLAIQGPKAAEAMQSLTDVDLSNMKFYTFEVAEFAGIDKVIISATGYTGSGGFEIYFKNEDAELIWDRIMEAGKDFGIKPIGLAARDTLRLEMGFCLYGNDIDETTSPIEAKLGWITKFTKDFINSEELKKEKEEGPKRKLIAFELEERGIPRQGYEIEDEDGKVIGEVTSGTMSPSLEKGIGLGYVPSEVAKFGNKIFIKVRKKSIPAVQVKLPFYKG